MGNLYLNITNECDFRCKYCYGNAGMYFSNSKLKSMPYEIADYSIKKLISIYKDKLRVVFFGGEPLLEFDLIRKVINNNLHPNIKFSIITNGSKLNDEIIDFLIKNKFGITVSFEGSEKAQKARVNLTKEGEYNNIFNNLLKLDKYNYPYNIRMTLYHDNHSIISRLENIAILKNVRSIRTQFVSPTNSQCDLIDSDFIEYIHDINNFEEDKLYFLEKCNFLDNKKFTRTICNMGVNGFSVDSEGCVYPCYRFTGLQKYALGNIYDFEKDKLWVEPQLRFINKELKSYCFAEEYLKSDENLYYKYEEAIKESHEKLLSRFRGDSNDK